jgi:hypothetical protein
VHFKCEADRKSFKTRKNVFFRLLFFLEGFNFFFSPMAEKEKEFKKKGWRTRTRRPLLTQQHHLLLHPQPKRPTRQAMAGC